MKRVPVPWRLIRSGYLSGAENMALDDALLHSVANGDSPPVLRLYRWRPAALSLGYAQPVTAGVDLAACRGAGIDVVRRPTGGRAVLHACEVTYAVMAPCAPPFGTSVTTSYRVIAGVLQETLRRLGVAAELVPGQARGERHGAVCFVAPAQYELLVAGCKVAGCAQKRRGGAFLQHGSLPLDLDLGLLARLMPAGCGEDRARRLATVGWLNRFAASALDVATVEDALIDCFAGQLGVDLQPGSPTAGELAVAQQLIDRFYADPHWTLRGPAGATALIPAGSCS